ncbi:MAG: hypothetical protein ABEJ93_01315 [Candidatus Nanohalobium sp.]
MGFVENEVKGERSLNANRVADRDPETVLDSYEEAVYTNPDSFEDYIFESQDYLQQNTGVNSTCTIESEVDTLAFVQLSRLYLDEGSMDLDKQTEEKVASRVHEILSRDDFDAKRAAEVGFEIDRRYSVEDKTYTESWTPEADEEMIKAGEDAAIIS